MTQVPFTTRPRVLAAQLLRYAFVGVLTNLVGYLVYLLITYAGLGPKITMTLLYITGATLGFWGNRTITFRHREKGLAVGMRYILAHGVGYLINLTLLYTLGDRLGYAHQLVQGFAIFVVAGFLFVAFKYFVFPNPLRPSGAAQ